MSEKLDIIISEKGGREVVRTIDEVAHSAGAASGAITGLKLAVAGLTNALSVLGFLNASILTPIALLVGSAVAARSAISVFGDFEEQMNATAVAAGATAYQQDLLAQSARRLSLEWGIANNVIAGGMEDLAKAGVSAQDIIDGAAEATIVLAQAVGAELPEAATIAARAMNVFGFGAEDMMYVANQVAGTVNTTTFNLNDYMLALGQAGAIAADQRIPFEEFNAGLAAASAYFTSGSDQGTSFRTFLLRLTPVTDEAKRAIRSLGLEFRDAEGFLLPLPEIVDELQRALAPLDDESRTMALKEIFGEDAYRLAAFYMQQGGDAIREFRDEVIPAADAAEMARARLDGLWGSMRKLKTAVSEFFLVILETGIGDAFAMAIDAITFAVKGLTAVLKFLAPVLPFIAARFLTLAGGFITRGILLLGSAFRNLAGWLIKIFPALTGITSLFRLSPFGIFSTVVLTAGLALAQFSDKIQVSRDGLVSLQDVAAVVWEDTVNGLADMVTEAGNWFKELWNQADESFGGIEETAGSTWDKMLGSLQDWAKDSLRAIATWIAAAKVMFQAMGDALQGQFWSDEDLERRVRYMQRVAREQTNAWFEDVAQRARGLARDRANRDPHPPGDQPWELPDENDSQMTRSEYLQSEARSLQDSLVMLKLYNREREVQNEVLRINNYLIDEYNQSLSTDERRILEDSIRLYQERARFMGEMDRIIEGTIGKQEAMVLQQQALNALIEQGGPMVGQYTQQLRDLQMQMLEMQVNNGSGSFADGFMLELARMTQGVESLVARMGQSFGQMFSGFADGFANSVARSIVYAEDLGAALQDVARSALTELLSALIKMGIQWLINATMGQAIATSMTAASVAQAAAVSAAWAPAAAAVSLASYGANAIPAMSGIASTYGLTQALSQLGSLGMRDGGWVSGAGGPRDDMVPRLLSNGEFVVNAGAAARHRDQLEAMNSGRGGGGGSVSLNVPITVNAPNATEKTAAEIGREIERSIVPTLSKMLRPGGMLYNAIRGK